MFSLASGEFKISATREDRLVDWSSPDSLVMKEGAAKDAARTSTGTWKSPAFDSEFRCYSILILVQNLTSFLLQLWENTPVPTRQQESLSRLETMLVPMLVPMVHTKEYLYNGRLYLRYKSTYPVLLIMSFVSTFSSLNARDFVY